MRRNLGDDKKRKGQMFSLDLLVSIAAITLAIGLLLQAVELNTYNQQEERERNEVKHVAETVADLLVASDEVMCLDGTGRYMMNCIRSDVGADEIKALVPLGYAYEITGLGTPISSGDSLEGKDYYEARRSLISFGAGVVAGGPISIMLAMDESKSMQIYDMKLKDVGGSMEDGKCGGSPCAATQTNCGDITIADYTLIGTFAVNAAFESSVTLGDFEVAMTYDPADYTGICTKPKIIVVRPDGTQFVDAWRANKNEPSSVRVPVEGDYGDYEVYVWSDEEVDYSVWLWDNVVYEHPFPPPSLEGGTSGAGIECITFDNWVELQSENVVENQIVKIDGQIQALGYEGACDFQNIELIDPSGTIYSRNAASTTGPPNFTTYGLLPWSYESAPNKLLDPGVGPYYPPGNWIVNGWSDETVNGVSQIGVHVDLTSPPAIPGWTGTIANSTCGGALCGILAAGNCGDPATDWDYQDTYTVAADEHLLGIMVKGEKNAVPSQGYRYYNGVCEGPQFKLDGAWATSDAPDEKPDGSFELEIEAVAPPLPAVDWDFSAWSDNVSASDNPTTYTAGWHQQRVDAAKKAAKYFIDTAAWKDDDEIGMVSFSKQGSLEQPLVDALASGDLVKNALNDLRPDTETGIASAIRTAANAFPIGSTNDKVIILLTDGRADYCIDALGVPYACNEADAAAQAIGQADDARVKGITIYVIGFADSSLIGPYEDNLREIAKHDDADIAKDKCPDGDTDCGKYYYAADAEALKDVYDRIELEVSGGGPSVEGDSVGIKVWRKG